MAESSSPIRKRSGSVSKQLQLLVGFLAVGLLAAGCGGQGGGGVEIRYRQLAYFPSYEPAPGSPSNPGPDGAYILYRITSVKNDSDGPFLLNPNRLIAVQDKNTKEHAAHETELLGDLLLKNANLEPGKSQTDGLGCTILVARVNDAEKTFGNFGGTVARVDLRYEKIGDQAVKTVREEGNTGFKILEPANPETIQNECREGSS